MALQAVSKQLRQKQQILDRELEQSGMRKKWERQMSDEGSGPISDSTSYRAIFSWDEQEPEMTVMDSLWHYHSMLHAAVLMIEPGSGEIRVWIGGNHFRYLPYDLVKAKRQAASAFKPFLYAAAIEQGFEPCDYLDNEWEEREDYPGWQPQNYDRSTGGDIPMWYALSRSLNIPSVNLYMALDREELQLQCQLFGLPVPEEEQPSLALGSEEYSLEQMVQAYSAFATFGGIAEPVLVEAIYDRSGNEIYTHSPAGRKKALGSETAGLVNKMLINAE
jgi:penicillin-binding protein 1A